MLDNEMWKAILMLRNRGMGTRAIAKALKVSRTTVKRCLVQNTASRPPPRRPGQLDAHHELVRELYQRCQGNMVRVHEELAANNVTASYQAKSGNCRV